jgi:hypothetical protein
VLLYTCPIAASSLASSAWAKNSWFLLDSLPTPQQARRVYTAQQAWRDGWDIVATATNFILPCRLLRAGNNQLLRSCILLKPPFHSRLRAAFKRLQVEGEVGDPSGWEFSGGRHSRPDAFTRLSRLGGILASP